MKMPKNISYPLRVVILFLLLLGSSETVFSANQDCRSFQTEEDKQEVISTSLVGEQLEILFDSILPFHKNINFLNSGFNLAGDFDALKLDHTVSSLSYIKRSRYIFPNLGVKEVIFPFHVFL